jgi:hypothetical protein
MTTRWKTRTAPAAKPATPEAFESLPYDGTTADIRKMIARVHFLEAEGRYHAVIAGPDRDRHWKEIDAIIQRLAVDVPGSFDDAMKLLEFATLRLKLAAPLDDKSPLVAMFKNSAAGFMKAHVKLRVDHTLRRFEERQFAEVEVDI